jgi:mycothiol synthase
MKIQSYAFGDEDDLQTLKAFVSSIMTENMQRSYWHVGDLVWGIYQNTIYDPRRNVRLWENEQGELLGFAWINSKEVILQVSPHLDATKVNYLLEQMIAWGEEHQQESPANGNAPPSFYAFDNDLPLKNLLLRHGYRREESHSLHMRRDLNRPIPQTVLPEGWVVRHVAGENEFEQRVALHREVWHPSKVTLEAYRRMRHVPGYTPELDLVAVSSEGSFASYCICWLDPVSKIGEFEPVGTRSAFRGKGLGKAVMLEGLQRLKASGMETAIVCSVASNEASGRLYKSVGFEVYGRSYEYVKRV